MIYKCVIPSKTHTHTRQKPVPVTTGTGFYGYGYGFLWDTPGLPVTFPSGDGRLWPLARIRGSPSGWRVWTSCKTWPK